MNRIRSELETIPGVGSATAKDLESLNIKTILDLKGQNPELLYEKLMHTSGHYHDRYVLYVFRCAVYYAEIEAPQAKLLKWWNWKDKKL